MELEELKTEALAVLKTVLKPLAVLAKKYLIERLKALAAKTDSSIDDAIVAIVEKEIEKLIEEKIK